jgi:hypothetical protein
MSRTNIISKHLKGVKITPETSHEFTESVGEQVVRLLAPKYGFDEEFAMDFLYPTKKLKTISFAPIEKTMMNNTNEDTQTTEIITNNMDSRAAAAEPDTIAIHEAVKVDFKHMREQRQKNNNKQVLDAIESGDIERLTHVVNNNELDRVLNETGLSIDDLVCYCKKCSTTSIILAGRISKCSSRQGTKDEHTQLSTCNEVLKPLGIFIKNLSPSEFRPKKDGTIVSGKEYKKYKLPKTMFLKSFDGQISGRVNGWIFAKVVIDKGGHQDNVHHEIEAFCEWVSTYKRNEKDIYVVMVDSYNIDSELNKNKIKYSSIHNLIITNHFEFQKTMIDKYANLTRNKSSM